MNFFRRFAKPVSLVVTAGVLTLSLQLPAANAAMVNTESVVRSLQAQQEFIRIQEVLDREEVKAQLAALGVDPSQVQARVAALSDEEVEQLSQQLEELPAGGGVLGMALFVFVLLLITDLLGLTDVFPFTKKGSLRR